MLDELVGKYIQIRDAKTNLERQHKERIAKLDGGLDKLEAAILGQFQAQGIESARTPHGTAYRSMRTHATVKDWSATLDHIRAFQAWDLLEKRVSKTAVVAMIEETGSPPPGVDVFQQTTVNVRRS